MFFSSWDSLVRLVAVGVPAYVGLVLLLRISGKRTLSKFNAFDLVVTVAFGSTLSAGLLSRNLALIDILAAFALLVLLQFVVTWSSMRWGVVDSLVKSDPQLLFHRGAFLRTAMKHERVSEGEVLAAVRNAGYGAIEQVESVVLETDGTISVIAQAGEHASALHNVAGHPEPLSGAADTPGGSAASRSRPSTSPS